MPFLPPNQQRQSTEGKTADRFTQIAQLTLSNAATLPWKIQVIFQ